MRDISIEEWFNLYAQQVHNYLVYFTRNRDVEDLVQETFLKALRKIDSYNETSSPVTWLISIARHLAIDDHRRLKKNRLTYVELVGHNIPARDQSPEVLADLKSVRDQLLNVVETMRPSYRDVVILRLFLDLSISDCSRILGWSESKVKTTQRRALKRLRSDLTFQLEEEQYAF